jgi:hypothetical protein
MRPYHLSPWIELLLVGVCAGLLIWAVVLHEWQAVFMIGTLLFLTSRVVADGFIGLRRGDVWKGRHYDSIPGLGRAQSLAIVIVFLFGYTGWQVMANGAGIPVAVSAAVPVAAVVWLVLLIRREGWSGDKVEPSATSDQ